MHKDACDFPLDTSGFRLDCVLRLDASAHCKFPLDARCDFLGDASNHYDFCLDASFQGDFRLDPGLAVAGQSKAQARG